LALFLPFFLYCWLLLQVAWPFSDFACFGSKKP
jgi:hypothetical protein